MSKFVHLENCTCLLLTDKAAKIRLSDGQEEFFPFSQMAEGEEDKLEVGLTDFTLSVTEWIMKEKRLDPDDYSE